MGIPITVFIALGITTTIAILAADIIRVFALRFLNRGKSSKPAPRSF